MPDLRRIAPGRVIVTVPIEAHPGRQAAVIGIGEVGRHLTILGLCAASALNRKTGRHAYLARTARVNWLAEPTLAPKHDPLIGHAQAVFDTSRRARADTRLTDVTTGEVLVQMAIGYDVLPYRLLAYLFGEPQPDTPSTDNPYAAPMLLDSLKFDDATGTGTISGELHVTADLCQAHFGGHPILPVAIAATAMTNLVDHGMSRRSRRPSGWQAPSASGQTTSLARARRYFHRHARSWHELPLCGAAWYSHHCPCVHRTTHRRSLHPITPQ